MRPLGRDPAPSRLSYRLERLWLTPGIRRLAKWGPPLLFLGSIILYVVLSPTIRTDIGARLTALTDSIVTRDGLMVERLEIHGASPELRHEVAVASSVTFPRSSLKIDVKALRERITNLPAVAQASVRIGPGGTLSIDVTERLPAVLWRDGDVLKVVDATGVVIAVATGRSAFPNLPLVLGDGADKAVGEAMEISEIARPFQDRIRGLRRIGARRWTLVLDNSQEILLPEDRPAIALRRVMGLNAADNLLERDISRIDMRDPARPVLRVGTFGMTELRRLQRIERGEE